MVAGARRIDLLMCRIVALSKVVLVGEDGRKGCRHGGGEEGFDVGFGFEADEEFEFAEGNGDLGFVVRVGEFVRVLSVKLGWLALCLGGFEGEELS